MDRISALTLCCAALLLPSVASAQQYVVSTSPSTYQALPLAGGSPTTLVTSTTDDGAYTIPLPFPFTYFNQTYSAVNVGTNGIATFGSHDASRWSNESGFGLLNSTPDNLIAVWWDDMGCDSGQLKHQTIGQPGGREVVVEWGCYDLGSPSSTIQAQLWLTEGSSVIRVKYGAINGSAWTASMGIENEPRTVVIEAPANCGTNCTHANWPGPNVMVQYGVSVEPDLLPQVALGPMVTVGTDLSFPVNTTIRNLGQNAGTNVIYDVYRSSDAVLDPAADLLLVSHTNPETVPGEGAAMFTDPVTMPRPDNGQYWICVNVDPLNTIVESNEGNNRGCMPVPFLVGSDLLGRIFLPDDIGAPGETLEFDITIQNQGSDATGNFGYRIWLSADQTLQTGLDTVV